MRRRVILILKSFYELHLDYTGAADLCESILLRINDPSDHVRVRNAVRISACVLPRHGSAALCPRRAGKTPH